MQHLEKQDELKMLTNAFVERECSALLAESCGFLGSDRGRVTTEVAGGCSRASHSLQSEKDGNTQRRGK